MESRLVPVSQETDRIVPHTASEGEVRRNHEPLLQLTRSRFYSRCVLAAWERIWSRNWKRAIVIAHAGTNRILLAEFLGIPDENLFRIAQDYLGINCVEFVENTPTVQTINAPCSS